MANNESKDYGIIFHKWQRETIEPYLKVLKECSSIIEKITKDFINRAYYAENTELPGLKLAVENVINSYITTMRNVIDEYKTNHDLVKKTIEYYDKKENYEDEE